MTALAADHNKMTPKGARAELGRQVERLRRELGKSASAVAKEAGISVSYYRRVEHGQRAVWPTLAAEIARAIGVGGPVAASWYWLATIAVGSSVETRAYLLERVFPAFVTGDCEVVGGPVVFRESRLRELAEYLQAALKLVQLGPALHVAEVNQQQVETEIRRANMIAVDDIIEAFPGPSHELRCEVMGAWYDGVHPDTRREMDGHRYVSPLTPLPCGRLAGHVGLHRGRSGKRVSPEAWRRFLDYQMAPLYWTASRAYWQVKREARENGWVFEPSERTLRSRMCTLVKGLPALKLRLGARAA